MPPDIFGLLHMEKVPCSSCFRIWLYKIHSTLRIVYVTKFYAFNWLGCVNYLTTLFATDQLPSSNIGHVATVTVELCNAYVTIAIVARTGKWKSDA